MNKEKALEILDKEEEYEEEIAKNLTDYYLASLDYIEDLTIEEKKEVFEKLSKLREDTIRHEQMFQALINHANENEKNNF